MQIRSLIPAGLLAVMLFFAVCLRQEAFAVSTVTVASTGDGVFTVQGTGIEDAAALEMNVLYDTAALANPRFVSGPLIAGAMTAVNPDVPGTVRMVIIRLTPVKGSGQLATLTFSRTGPSPGRILSFSAKLANINGAPLPVQTRIINPPDASTPASTPQQDQAGPSGTASSGQVGAGTPGTPAVIAPTVVITGPPSGTGEARVTPETTGPREQAVQPMQPGTGREPLQEPPVVARRTPETASTATAPARKIFAQKSVLERFGEYRGERTVRALLTLFEQNNFIGFRQEPPVALSDGRSSVKVTFLSTPGDRTSSDVAVSGARLLSMKRDPDNTNTWIVELMPEKGGYQASISVAQGELMMVYPLTVAPRIDLAGLGTVTEADLDRALMESKIPAQKPSQLDLNGDGKRDHIDDYILTANHLASNMK